MASLNVSLTSPYVTWSYSKLSCWKGAYFAHVIFSYFILLSGLACFITRVWPRFKWTHIWFGRAYIISMLWATASSIAIHNTGLAVAVLVSFLWVMGGMTIAWVAISIHQALVHKQALNAATRRIKAQGKRSDDLQQLLAAEKARLAEQKTFGQRLLSLKAMHGALMFTSWSIISGRMLASDQSGDFTCYTQPAYKPITTKHFAGADHPLQLLPTEDPQYSRLPWGQLGQHMEGV